MAKEQLFQGYLSSALFLVQNYSGRSPFSSFLKDYFGSNKRFGARDRKYISQLCYCYYRTGHALDEAEPKARMLDSLFLCSAEGNELLQNLHPEWNEEASLSLKEKFVMLSAGFRVTDIFPWADELSEGVDAYDFCLSHLIQPSLFLRIRPGWRKEVISKLHSHSIAFKEVNEECLAFQNTTRLENVLAVDKEVVVQDYNSQGVGGLMRMVSGGPSYKVWDCCAASGGKSILLYDIKPSISLTVSDIRENILTNLRKRFKTAGIHQYKSFTADLSKGGSPLPAESFQLILADVPCSGSGTWSRSPEQLCFFDKTKIAEYAALQKKILANAVPCLQKGGHLLYSTCSVFKKENEDVVEFLQEKFQLQLVKMELLEGYTKKADTLFAALLRKAS